MSNSQGSGQARTWSQAVLRVGVIAAGVALAYHHTFSVPELLDDPSALSENPSIRQLSALGHVLNPPANAGTGGRPLANLSFALNYAWSGRELWTYHLFNLAVHVAAAAGLLGILRRTLRRWLTAGRADSIAFCAALLWAVHPVATVSVTYLSQRTESLMGCFYLLTLYTFIRGTEERSATWHFLSFLACVAGMASKEVMVTAPVIVLLYDRTFVAGSFRDALRARPGYYAGLAATWLFLAMLLRDVGHRQAGFGLGVEWWRYLLTECQAWFVYAKLVIWPAPLIFDYGRIYLTWSDAWPFAVGAGTVILFTLHALKSRPRLGFGLAWFLIILAPTSSIVPIAQQPIAENRIYLAGAIVVTGLTLGLYRLVGRRSLVALAAIALGLVVVAERRNELFRSPLALWSDTVAKRPQNARGFDYLGKALQEAGRANEAIASYKHALELNEQSYSTHGMLADLYTATGQHAEAAQHYLRAIELNPSAAMYYANLASVLVRAGDLTQALSYYAKALELAPEFAIVHSNLGKLYLRLGRYQEAAEHLEKALHLGFDDGYARALLGGIMLQLGRNADALAYLEKAAADRPDDPDIRSNYGVALLRFNRNEEAMRQLETALQLKPDHATARQVLESLRQTNLALPETRR